MIAKGGSGGHGRLSRKSSHGATLMAIVKLNRGERVMLMIKLTRGEPVMLMVKINRGERVMLMVKLNRGEWGIEMPIAIANKMGLIGPY